VVASHLVIFSVAMAKDLKTMSQSIILAFIPYLVSIRIYPAMMSKKRIDNSQKQNIPIKAVTLKNSKKLLMQLRFYQILKKEKFMIAMVSMV
jgi:hypothetical protein